MERETQLSAAFVRLADTLVADFDVADLLRGLVDDCLGMFDADAAGLLLADEDGTLRVVAASNEQIHLLDLLQIQADEGPCLDCFRTSQPVMAASPAEIGDRWPEFAPAVARHEFRAVHALPLRLRSETIGALNLFREQPRPMTDAEVRTAQALADVATIGILQARAIRRRDELTDQLRAALDSRVVIEQAKGRLAERGGIDMEEAFLRLRSYARSHRRPMSDVAGELVNGTLTVQPVLRVPRQR